MTANEFLEDYLGQPSAIPQEWIECRFYFLRTIFGIVCCLAHNGDVAVSATLVYFGRVSRPSLITDHSDKPIMNSYPSYGSGPCQYLDASLALSNDPSDVGVAFRDPDSSPASAMELVYKTGTPTIQLKYLQECGILPPDSKVP